MEHGGRGFRAGRTKLSAARIANFRGIVQASTTRGDRRRRSYCLHILVYPLCVSSLKPAVIVETAVGPLLTISGRCPEKSPWTLASSLLM